MNDWTSQENLDKWMCKMINYDIDGLKYIGWLLDFKPMNGWTSQENLDKGMCKNS